METLDHRSQTVLVTGASSGIGAQFAQQLAARGSDLVLAARRRERLESLAAELRGRYGVSVTPVTVDLAAPAIGAALADDLDRRGLRVTSVVNNAGFGQWGRFHEADPELLRQVIAVDVAAVVDISRAFIGALRAAGSGYLLNTTSVAAYSSVPNQAVYSASKAFVLSFTEALWAESRGSGVRVLAFAPGVTSSEFFEVVGTTDADGGSRYQTPTQVVTAALRVLDRRDPPPSAVSGTLNHALTLAGRLFTRRRAVTLTAANTLRQRT